MDYEIMAFEGLITSLHSLAQGIQDDLEKVAKGNKTAAQRVRTESLAFEKCARIFRKRSMKEVM